MTPQVEILKRLRAMPVLDAPVRLYAWPTRTRPQYDEHLDEFYRICGSVPLSWKWANKGSIDAAVDRCRRVGATLCLHVSPVVPDDSGCVHEELEDYHDQWQQVIDWIDDRVSLSPDLIIDMEGYQYDHTDPPTPDSIQRNRLVRDYNFGIYETAKQFVGPEVTIHRWGHLAVQSRQSDDFGGRGVAAHTTAYDPVDGGFNLNLYRPIEPDLEERNLRDTIEQAKRFGVNTGSLWLMLGAQKVPWQCPGIELFPEWKYGVRLVPYDPQDSFVRGRCFNSDWMSAIKHGESQRNGRFAKYDAVKMLCLWPGVFEKGMDRTMGPHLCAFLDGLGGRKWDPALQQLQKQYWEA